MGKPKRAAYTALGFVAWKALAIAGVKDAKDKVAEHQAQKKNTATHA
jgi:hypothetical protein